MSFYLLLPFLHYPPVPLSYFRDEKTGELKVVKDERTGKPLLANTNVDLVFGDDRHDVGLDHIIRKHHIRQNDYISIQALEDSIVNTFRTLDVNDPQSGTETLINNEKRAIKFSSIGKKRNKIVIGTEIRKDDKGKEMIRHFILTSYDVNRQMKEKFNTIEVKKERLKWYEKK